MAAKKIRKGKRRWYPIQAPKAFNNQPLGETFIWETEQLENKVVNANLMTLTGNPKKQNMNVFFAVAGVEEGVAKTKTVGIEMQHSSLKRLVRRGRSKVADSFVARTKKGVSVRIKPIIMTRTRADAATQTALRKRARELLVEALSKYAFETIVSDIANMRLQKHLKDQLSSIFPVRSVDIRYLRYTTADTEDEDDLEESEYEERPKREREEKEAEGLASLKSELDEALAAEKDDDLDEPRPKQAKKAAKKKTAEEPEGEDDEE